MKFKNYLLSLGNKALTALPGIILKAAASAVGFLAEHLIIAVAITILVIIQVLTANVGYIKEETKKISSKINEHKSS